RQCRNAEIQFTRAVVDLDLDLDAAVLRQALLGDVELRHDLETRDERVADLKGRMHHIVQNAVYTEANSKILFVRLDVDVRCAAPERVHHQHVDKTNDRGILGRPSQL